MNRPNLSSTVAQAEDFLSEIPPQSRSRGDAYFREGRVLQLTLLSPASVMAIVQGSDEYEVSLTCDSDGDWLADCSCPMEFACKHIYAAMKALLATGIQWNGPTRSGATALRPAHTKAQPPVSSFAEEIAQALDRPLQPAEKKYIKQLDAVFARCRMSGNISHWDFNELGFHLRGYGWEALRIWPSPPRDVREFWLYVANAAYERGLQLPQFMLPVTDFKEVQERLRKWRRGEDINRWKQVLGNAMAQDAHGKAGDEDGYQLRARFLASEVVLEWKSPRRTEFMQLKASEARQLQHDLNCGSAALSAPAELVWDAFEWQVESYRNLEISYNSPDIQALHRLLRLPACEALLVNPDGKPFERPQQVLRWQLDPASDEKDDYRLRVALPDGSPLPPLLCVLEGRPTLFVTQDAVFRGPASSMTMIVPNRENVIPAPALESRAGAIFLHSMGVELPPRLRDRVKTIPLHVSILCLLKETYRGSEVEVCSLEIMAQTPDGNTVERWNGRSWSPVKDRSKETQQGDVITIHDRSALGDGNSLLVGLDVRWDGYQGGGTVRLTKKFPEQFAAWLKSLPPKVKVHLKGELASFGEEAVAGHVRLDVNETEIDWFDLRVVLDVADTTLTQEELKLLLNAKGGFVRLAGKGWRKLQFNLAPEEDEQLARLGLSPRELSAEPQRLHALQLADNAAKKFLPEPQFADIQRRAEEIKARVTPAIPESVQATLRPYQADGFHFLAYLSENRFGGILADDMGLGKTLQTLTWLAWLRDAAKQSGNSNLPSLVVCPKSVMDNWHAEVERFAPDIRVKVWTASEANQLLDRAGEADLHVLNYNQLRLLGESLTPIRWLAVILDEGQYIKNPNSQTAQIARALKSNHRLVLSGTPIENRLLDLWSLMAFAMPGILGSRAQFAKLYDAKEDPFARRRLSARVRPFLLRRTKAQVAKDLPDRIEEDLFCEMEGEQRTLYRAELKRAQQMLLKIKTQKQLSKERFHFLTSLLRLRQIACHPRLVKPDSKAASTKVEALLEQLEPLMEEGHKVLVFSQFVEMLDILRTQLKPLGHPLFYLAGDTENRGELVQQFQATNGAAIFLISLKAGGFGLNLTAASYVVLFDPWWNPAVENQAIDRTHRIGQTRNVIAYRLLIKDSIEEKIRQLQKTKSALAEDVLGEEKFGQNLTLDDLRFLLSDGQ